jgi:hypothetical protein
MQRYSFYQFDGSTFIVFDNIEKSEICICSNYNNRVDAKGRTVLITALLNESVQKNTISMQ